MFNMTNYCGYCGREIWSWQPIVKGEVWLYHEKCRVYMIAEIIKGKIIESDKLK